MGPKLESALKDAGAVLKRDKKHLVYELPNGQNVTVAKSPSDKRAEANALSDLRRAIGPIEKVAKPPRQHRAEKPGRREPEWTVSTPLAAKLKETGVYYQALTDKITGLEAELAQAKNEAASQRALREMTSVALDFAVKRRAATTSRYLFRVGSWFGLID